MIRTTLTRTEYPIVKRLSQSEYPRKIKISQKQIKVKINNDLPFRVKFLPGIVSGSSPTNPAPIGIAIVGVNNYIL
jgi:hypothetical protein